MAATSYRKRTCVCGKVFKGANSKCRPCQAVDRVCPCGAAFKGLYKKCSSCRVYSRVCACGKAFKGERTQCLSCRSPERTCACGKSFKGTNSKCGSCQSTRRVCACGEVFQGVTVKCRRCQSVKRTCPCGKEFKGARTKCHRCRWEELPEDLRIALARNKNGRRRALRVAAQVAGPVSVSAYEAIRQEGPCVYCGSEASTVDHIVPLVRGGWEHETNLVPACQDCNSAKRARLLEEWDRDLVAHAVRVSPKVAAVYAERFHHEGDTYGH